MDISTSPAVEAEYEDDEPHLTEMTRQAETREADDGYWGDGDLW